MKFLISFVLRFRVAVILTVLGIVVAGGVALSRLAFDAFPDLTGTRVEVITVAAGLAPEEVERLVTFPIESALMGLPGAEGVRSISKAGLSLITVPFPDGMDVYFARTLVQQRLNDAKEMLPDGVEPGLGPVATPMGEVYQYTLTSDSMSLTELTTLNNYTISPRLRTVPGVAEVDSWGGLTEQIHVEVNPISLAARGLTLEDVDRALAENNLTFGGGYVERAGERFTIRGVGRVAEREDLGSIVLRSENGVPVRISDVALVKSGALPRQGAVTQNGEGEVVEGAVLKLQGADSRRVIEAVETRMSEIIPTLPSHVKVTSFYNQTDLVTRTTHTIAKNLLEGGLLVIAVLFLFLRNIRASFIVASVIPLSMFIAFIAMKLFGYSANLMSMGALDFGLIVDASVVMVENIIRRLESRPPGNEDERRELFRSAFIEVGRPVLFGVAIIVAVYIPIFTLNGMEGRMFKPMAFTVVSAVLGSLLLALTYVPAVSAMVLRHVHEEPSRMQEWMQETYLKILEWHFTHTKIVIGTALALVVVAVASLGSIGSEFMPKLDEGTFLINTKRLPSVSLVDAARLSTEAEKIVKSFPEVVTAVTKEGRSDLAVDAMGLFEGDQYVVLKPRSEWTTAKTREELIEKIDSALSVIPGLWISFTQPMAMRLDEAESGIRTDLGVKIVGPDLDQNQRVAEQIRRVIDGVPGAADVGVEVSDGAGQIRVDIRRDALARYGVSVADVQRMLDLTLGLRPSTELIDGARRVGVAVTLPEGMRSDVDELARLMIRIPSGGQVPLGELADIVSTTAPELIGHEDAQRRTLVLSNVRGRDLGSFVREVRDRVASEVRLPAGVFLEWGGQYENQTRAMARLRLVVPMAILLIFMLLYASFRSFPQAFLVLLNVPFALVGGIATLWIRGLNLSLSASVGFIALFGIAVLNGVVLVTHLNSMRDTGVPLDETVRIGSADRLRPVLMTALVAGLGFIPMALSQSAGSEVQRPLASVVIGGIVTSTVLTLLVLPVLYRLLERALGTYRARSGTGRVQRKLAGLEIAADGRHQELTSPLG
ncbi:MAG: CusA/CzcA family heavy metal efflux RND transporter [Gemmatimonadota bacterium]|jgi:cobalt-zinc-cadmium resistance protein CzcA|nr:CusA/CzcA family heavy metal efflux RND transporter [Gemmatimonadota bacterium]